MASPYLRNGVACLIGHDPDHASNCVRIYANQMGQLEVGGNVGKLTLNRVGGLLTTIVTEYDRPDGTVTKTRTITRDGDDRIIEISAAV